jgi:MYXO-CTERM domain-containing protein
MRDPWNDNSDSGDKSTPTTMMITVATGADAGTTVMPDAGGGSGSGSPAPAQDGGTDGAGGDAGHGTTSSTFGAAVPHDPGTDESGGCAVSASRPKGAVGMGALAFGLVAMLRRRTRPEKRVTRR